MTDEPEPTRVADLRAKSLRACERALDASLDADPSDIDRLRLGLDAAQMLMMICPPVWHEPPPPPYAPPPPYIYGMDVSPRQVGEQAAFMNVRGIRTVMSQQEGAAYHLTETDFFPEHPVRKDGLASGQSVTQDDLNLTSNESSGWLLDGDDAGDDQP